MFVRMHASSMQGILFSHVYIIFTGSNNTLKLIIIIIYLYNQVEYSEILSKTLIKNMTKQLSMALN